MSSSLLWVVLEELRRGEDLELHRLLFLNQEVKKWSK